MNHVGPNHHLLSAAKLDKQKAGSENDEATTSSYVHALGFKSIGF